MSVSGIRVRIWYGIVCRGILTIYRIVGIRFVSFATSVIWITTSCLSIYVVIIIFVIFVIRMGFKIIIGGCGRYRGFLGYFKWVGYRLLVGVVGLILFVDISFLLVITFICASIFGRSIFCARRVVVVLNSLFMFFVRRSILRRIE